MKRDSFIFYQSFYEAIVELPREIQGEVLTAVVEYGLYGETTESLKPIAKAMMLLIKPQIDANQKRYENGCKGGRPKKDTENLIKTKKKPNANLMLMLMLMIMLMFLYQKKPKKRERK